MPYYSPWFLGFRVEKYIMLVNKEVSHLYHLLFNTILHHPNRACYELAEKEFVSAKLELHRTKEEKELLSEHLCAIIHQTELRKAKKLAQLCQALGVNETPEARTIPTE